MPKHVLLSYGLNGKIAGKKLEGAKISWALKDDMLGWAHMDANHPDTRPWLEKEIAYLDPYVVEALMAPETRPRVTKIGKGILLILRGVNLNAKAKPEDMVSIRMYIDPHRIITLQKRPIKAISDLEKKVKDTKKDIEAGDFLGMLVAALFDRMEPVFAEMNEHTDELEEKVLETLNITLRSEISQVRKQAIAFRRYMYPQKDVIVQLQNLQLPWITLENKRQLQECQDDIMRHIETLDAIRERTQVVKDELANAMADRLNRNMYILSMISAIFIPATFLTGLFGINVGGIPGSGSEYAFWEFLGLVLTLLGVQLFIFKRLKWF